jgi:hypothetical protein
MKSNQIHLLLTYRMHMEPLMEPNNRERTSHQQLVKQQRDQFYSWYKSYVRKLLV